VLLNLLQKGRMTVCKTKLGSSLRHNWTQRLRRQAADDEMASLRQPEVIDVFKPLGSFVAYPVSQLLTAALYVLEALGWLSHLV
jgi:hypothetical protein